MKTILFNCSTNVVGGGVKNSTLFILNAIHNQEFNWLFAISVQVEELLENNGIQIDERFLVFSDSPSRSKAARKRLTQFIKKKKVNLVYTMAGPAYINFKVYHVLGLSNPYITHADFSAFLLYKNLVKITKQIILVGVQFYHSRQADHFVFQTNQAARSFCKRSGIDKTRTSVIYNAFDLDLMPKVEFQNIQLNANSKIMVFCPGAGYIHKGFQFIPLIAKQLKSLTSRKIEFILTLPDGILLDEIKHNSNKYDVEDMISNIGPYNYADSKSLFENSDIIFVPSLLETFSATYLEAILARKPLVVADKDFAHDICGDYASYVNPKDSIASAKVLFNLISTPLNPADIEEKGERILQRFGNQYERFEKIVSLLKSKLESLSFIK